MKDTSNLFQLYPRHGPTVISKVYASEEAERADLEWQNSEIRKACLTARSDREFKIKLPGDPQQWRLKKWENHKNVLIDKDRVFPILLKKNDRLEIEKI